MPFRLLINYYYYTINLFGKKYLENKNTYKPTLAFVFYWKIFNIFYKNYLKKPTSILLLIKLVQLIAILVKALKYK